MIYTLTETSTMSSHNQCTEEQTKRKATDLAAERWFKHQLQVLSS